MTHAGHRAYKKVDQRNRPCDLCSQGDRPRVRIGTHRRIERLKLHLHQAAHYETVGGCSLRECGRYRTAVPCRIGTGRRIHPQLQTES